MEVEKASPVQATGPRRAYTMPKLTCLGSVAEMTAAGCYGPNESANKPSCNFETSRKSNTNC